MKPIEIIRSKREHLARLSNKHGAVGEVGALAEMPNLIPRPRGKELATLLAALLASGVVIKGTAFDAILLPSGDTVDFTNAADVQAKLPSMVFIEVKTANQPRVGHDFSGFFFALTEGEIAAAEALGTRHRVMLYNNLTGRIVMTSIPDLVARAKSLNWQLSLQL